jgi:hypothetical protein
MKFKSQVYTQASGSIGGLTYSHNKGGMYTRARAIPTNPATAQQIAIRDLMAALTSAWNNTLTQPQRDVWADYAANVPRIDTLGDSRILTPLNWYIACNTARLQAGLSRIDVGPSIFNMALLTTPTVGAITASSDIVSIGFTNTDPWATAIGGALLVYTSRPVSPSLTFFKGPYRYAFRINGAVSPPTTPQTGSLAFPVVAAQKIFVQLVAVNADGRISSPFRGSGISV